MDDNWTEATCALENVDEPVAEKLRIIFEKLRAREDDDRGAAPPNDRHALGNLLTVAQANVEGMVDGVVTATPARLESVRNALNDAVRLMSKSPRGNVSHVEESLVVRCPYASARRYLESDMLQEAGGLSTRRLVVPLRGVQLSKTVEVMITPGEDPMHMEQPWHVRWTPEGGGPYPDFDGELTVRADEDWDSALLELRGGYSPPGGAAGRAFDRAVGKRIAAATARELLKTIAGSLETRYREQETAKNQPSEHA